METNSLDWIGISLVIVGALNWGVIGMTGLISGDEINVVQLVADGIFRPAAASVVISLVYILVGVAGLYLFYTAYKMGRASRRTSSDSITDTES